GVEVVARLENIPADSAGARRHAEYEFRRDQRAPGEGPTDLQAGEDRGEGRRDEDKRNVARALETDVAATHAQRLRYGAETAQRVERDGPQHRVDDHEHQR